MRFFSAGSIGLRGLVGVSVLAAALGACGGEVDTHYGPPSGLTGKTTPLPTGADGGGTTAPPTTTPDGGSGGTVSTLCGGNGPVDGGACTVSWKTGLYPKFSAGGAWKCADANCHGTKGGNAPYLSGGDSHADYLTLVAYNKINTTPYLNPCSTDPTKSTFACNVTASPNTCGTLRMPLTTGGATPLTAAEETDLKTWATCGSPEN